MLTLCPTEIVPNHIYSNFVSPSSHCVMHILTEIVANQSLIVIVYVNILFKPDLVNLFFSHLPVRSGRLQGNIQRALPELMTQIETMPFCGLRPAQQHPAPDLARGNGSGLQLEPYVR